jgi:hypothetical protein
MEIKNIQVKPSENSVHPALSFDIEITYTKYNEMIIGVTGFLESDDGKVVSTIDEIVPEVPILKREFGIGELGAKDSCFDREFKEETYKTTLIAILDRKTLNYLEDRRMKNKRGDVKLLLNLYVNVLVSKTLISHLHEVEPGSIGLEPKVILSSGREIEGKIIAYAYDSGFSTPRAN